MKKKINNGKIYKQMALLINFKDFLFMFESKIRENYYK